MPPKKKKSKGKKKEQPGYFCLGAANVLQLGNLLDSIPHKVADTLEANKITAEETRWAKVGHALNVTLLSAMQSFAETELQNMFNNIVRINGYLVDTKGEQLKSDPDNHPAPPQGDGVMLCFKALPQHKDKKNTPIAITTVQDFARLYTPEYTKKVQNFTIGTADSSSILHMLAKASCFPKPVKDLAAKIRDEVRNAWAHADIPQWDHAKFDTAFADLEALAKMLPNSSSLIADLMNCKSDVQNTLIVYRESVQAYAEMCRIASELKIPTDVLEDISNTNNAVGEMGQHLLDIKLCLFNNTFLNKKQEDEKKSLEETEIRSIQEEKLLKKKQEEENNTREEAGKRAIKEWQEVVDTFLKKEIKALEENEDEDLDEKIKRIALHQQSVYISISVCMAQLSGKGVTYQEMMEKYFHDYKECLDKIEKEKEKREEEVEECLKEIEKEKEKRKEENLVKKIMEEVIETEKERKNKEENLVKKIMDEVKQRTNKEMEKSQYWTTLLRWSNSVDDYNTHGPTLLHQACMVRLLQEGLTKEEPLYTRSLVGSMAELSSSTLKIPDIDIKAKFHLSSDWVKLKKVQSKPFYRIQVMPWAIEDVKEQVLKMRFHGIDDTLLNQDLELMTKGNFVYENGMFISSDITTWQLLGVIRSMNEWGLEVSQSSEIALRASELGLLNRVTADMDYDGMVCKRAFLSKEAFEKALNTYLGNTGDNLPIFEQLKSVAMCFFPEDGIQVDYTAAFHINDAAVLEEAKIWINRSGTWPSADLKRKIRQMGVSMVPASVPESYHPHTQTWWTMTYDLNYIIYDKEYSNKIDTTRILIILKDMRTGLDELSQCSHLLKSQILKNALAWAMWERQNDRDILTNRDLLLSTLKVLKRAFQQHDLKDFFTNLDILRGILTRYRGVVQTNFSRRIQGVISDLKESIDNLEIVLHTLNIKQLEFIDTQNEKIFHNQENMAPQKGKLTDYVNCLTWYLHNISPDNMAMVFNWSNHHLSSTNCVDDEGHDENERTFCHYFNNNKTCPYEEVGCKFRHEISENCYFGKSCKNYLCQFKHESVL